MVGLREWKYGVPRDCERRSEERGEQLAKPSMMLRKLCICLLCSVASQVSAGEWTGGVSTFGCHPQFLLQRLPPKLCRKSENKSFE